MVEITEEVFKAAYIKIVVSWHEPAVAANAVLSAVAPLIEAAVREECASRINTEGNRQALQEIFNEQDTYPRMMDVYDALEHIAAAIRAPLKPAMER